MASPLFKPGSILRANKKDKPEKHKCRASAEVSDKMSGLHDFKLVWDCLDGWHITDLKKKIISYNGNQASGLKKCPFCECQLQIVNKVEIT